MMRTKVLVIAACSLIPAMAIAATPKIVPPNQKVADIPVTQFQPLPPIKLPSVKTAAVGGLFTVQSYASNESTPTSAPPSMATACASTCSTMPDGCTYDACWPTKAQSITWWEANAGYAPGSTAYQLGSQYTHQDAEGWAVSCSYTPAPSCPTGAGWSGSYVWASQTTTNVGSVCQSGTGQQTTGTWQDQCVFTKRPSCPTTPGWSGSYSWDGTTPKHWVDTCVYTSAPPCSTGPGWTGPAWTGSSWVCQYHPRPSCPSGDANTYAWSNGSWSGSCLQPCPSSAGWTGSYEPNCHYQPQPACPSDYSGSYSWNGSNWVDGCQAPAPPAQKGITYNEYVCLGITPYGGGCSTNVVGTYTNVTPHCHPYDGQPTTGSYFATATNGYPPGVYCFVQ